MKNKEEMSEWAIEELKKTAKNSSDEEMAHIVADDILCKFLISLGYQKVVDEWEKIPKWYS